MKKNIDSFITFINHNFSENQIKSEKFYNDLLAFFSENENAFIIRRHKELKNEGYKNCDIYKLLSDDVQNHLFKGKKLTERQIKRIIYEE